MRLSIGRHVRDIMCEECGHIWNGKEDYCHKAWQ